MKLDKLFEGIEYLGDLDACAECLALAIDSRKCHGGSVFFAMRGVREDGNNYVSDAIANGAILVVSETKLPSVIPHIIVKDIRETLSLVCGNFYYNFHKKLKIIGVTGTNGKTTTCRMIKTILEKDNKRVAIFGTLGVEIGGVAYVSDLTTPDPIELHRFFQTAYLSGVEYVVMEVSAHAIYLKKLYGIKIDIGVFTNLTQDHLDFFGDMENYANTKASYFSPEFIKYAVVNVDDELGRKILQNGKVPTATFGIFNPADTFAIDYDCKSGIKSIVNTFDDIFELTSPFSGEFNLYNALGAITVTRLLGISILTIREAFFRMPEVEGRFNVLNGKRRVIIDFAHTPDGLKNLLQTARALTDGKVIVVFGCGGDRDSKKRSIMGEISAKNADFTVITSDNPRSENPMDIIREIEIGHKKVNRNYISIPDRKMAVEYAIISSTCDDIVVVAGKGAESYIEEKGIKRPYSDKNEVLEVFRRYNL